MTSHLPIVVNVVTPCSRPQNLPKLRRSLDVALARTSYTILRWWVVCDGRHVGSVPDVPCYRADIIQAEGVAGHAQRNWALDQISNGWVYFLDDDNLVHEHLLKALESTVAGNPQVEGILVAQEVGTGIRSARTPGRCQTDTAQFALTRRLVGDTRFDRFDYCADGGFIEAIYARNPGSFVITDQVLAYYNKLMDAAAASRTPA